MPTLFISYKRGTTAIGPLMERLRAAKYRLWFDCEDIHLGDPDWRACVDRGLERSRGVILGITPAACASEPVRYEVSKARELGLLIFPVILERVSHIERALMDIGLPKEQHVEDFTDADHWGENCDRLLRDLKAQGLRVTRHDLREQRGEEAHALHQRYLKQLVERIGRLQLSQIAEDQPDGVPVEQVYVDGPTPLGISIEMQDWHVVDWWITRIIERIPMAIGEMEKSTRHRPADLGYEADPLESLVEWIEQSIANFRVRWPNTKPTEPGPWENGPHENVLMLSAQDIAAVCDRLVILGAPGSGKSTFVRHLALCLAGAQIDGWNRPANLDALGQWPHDALTPVYIELPRFVNSEHFPVKWNELPTADHMWRYITADLLGADLAVYADDLKLDLEQGMALLILDGLDEVPYHEHHLADRQAQLRHLAISLNDVYGPSRIIVTSRPYAYSGWSLPGFEMVTLADFEEEQRYELTAKLYQAAGLDGGEAQAKAERLNVQLEPLDPQLKDRPLFLTLMAIIFLKNKEEGLPARRGALYRQSILLLLDRWTQSKPGTPSLAELLSEATRETLYERLAALAYDVHCACGEKSSTPEIEEELLYRHLKPMGRKVAAALIPYLSENAGVLVSPGQNDQRDVFHFAHRSFQEYLAASHLVHLCAKADQYHLIRENIEAQPQLWREPCRLAGDVLADTGRYGSLWDFVSDLLDEDVPHFLGANDPRGWSIWVAGQVTIEQELYQKTDLRRGERVVREALVAWLIKLIETPRLLEPPERAECGIALCLLGDLRPGVGLRPDGLPDIDWVEIPAGEFIYQDGEILTLPTFFISRYPVTFKQFQTFVDAPDGFHNPEWWEKLAADDKHKRAPGNQAYRFLNHPRENVSWYDAVAFCRWLSQRLGLEIRLPTAMEWEKAARGTDGRVYPYGRKYDVAKGNYWETGIKRTSAVGMFPDGASPYGVMDMSGGVWEWCATKYDFPEKSESLRGDFIIARGGCFSIGRADAKTTSVFVLGPGPIDRYANIGFRVVRSAPMP